MNSAVPSSTSAHWAAADTSTLQGRIDPDRDDDLYAAWQSIFDRARPVQAAAGLSAPAFAAGGAGEAAAIEHSPAGAGAEPEAAASADACSEVTTPLQTRRSGAAGRTSPLAALLAAKHAVLGTEGMGTAWPQTQPVPGLRAAEPVSDAVAEHRAVSPQPAAAQPQSSSPDSVSVFVQGAAVAIVVRDAAMSKHDAVRCGFETARRLTGQGTALQQLTLNGRVLYQQRAESNGSSPEPPARALVFAC